MKYLLEIGTEEIPSRFLLSLVKDLEQSFIKRLEGINFKGVRTFATYRRLAILIEGISEQQESKDEEVKGPPEKVAINNDGSYTKAGIGFLKKFGADSGYIKDGYLYVNVYEAGKMTKDVLGSLAKETLASLYLPVAMKWGKEKQKFYRPVHFIVSLLDGQVIPFEFAGIKAGNHTKGHRLFSVGDNIEGIDCKIDFAGNYEKILEENGVCPCFKKRKELIVSLINKVTSNVSLYDDLLNEVCGLVESPSVLQGEFDEDFLQIPDQILITTMKKNQKYFPVIIDGRLTNKFLIVADNVNSKNQINIVQGNQKVLRARLCDAKFFYEEDTKHDFDFFMEQLKNITFQQKLGSIYDKIGRNISLVEFVSDKLKLSKAEKDKALLISKYAKADLATTMVFEFTELQGYIGQQYAKKWGIGSEIADGIFDHYKPSFAGDSLPGTLVSCIVSVADKIETIVGQFVIGKIPSGSQDPFGLRRQANGVVRIFYETDFFSFSLNEIIVATLDLYKSFCVSKEVSDKLFDFFEQRIEQYLKEKEIENDVIQAIKTLDIVLLKKRLKYFDLLLRLEKKKDVLEAIIRTINITKGLEINQKKPVDPFLFEDVSERDLFDKFHNLLKKDFGWDELLIAEWLQLSVLINHFFEAVMVMSEDDKIRNNRLNLLCRIRDYFLQFGDFKALQI